jgi:colanic acid/amylovoran biosynthesis glycosyltransferase
LNEPNVPVLHYVGVFSLLTETFIYDQVRIQREEGFDARVLTHERMDPEGRPFASVRVVSRPPRLSGTAALARARRILTRSPLLNSSTARMTRAIREEGVEVVHAHYGWGGAYALEATRAAELPLVTSFYGRDATENQGPEAERTLPPLFEGADRILALSSRMIERLVGLGCPREKLTVHHLGIETGALPFRSPAIPSGDGPLRIVAVGRLVPKKGMDVLLDAVGRLARDGRRTRLTIVGGGPEEGRLRRLAEGLGSGAEVELTGGLSRAEAMRRMREADLFVLASRVGPDGDAEGTPTVILEAPALGLPVVSTIHEGIPECLPPENREWLAPEGDSIALGERIEAFASDPARWEEIARRGRSHVEEAFDTRRQAHRAFAIYREVLGG